MSTTRTISKEKAQHEMAEVDAGCPFGPGFFLQQLRAFIRDRCPDPSEALPSVQLHLAEGERIEICHLIGIAPRWLAIAAIEEGHALAAPSMRTEIIPYALISRVTVRPFQPEPGRLGFEVARGPEILSGLDSPEAAFLAMAGVTPHGSQSARPGPERSAPKERSPR